MSTKQITPLLTVRSLEGLREFYVRHFGMRVTFDSPGFLGLALPDAPEQSIGYMLYGGCEPAWEGGGVTWGLEVDDVDAWHDRLRAALTVVRPLQDNPWGDRSFVVLDPAGVAVYVHTPIPLAPEYAEYAKSE